MGNDFVVTLYPSLLLTKSTYLILTLKRPIITNGVIMNGQYGGGGCCGLELACVHGDQGVHGSNFAYSQSFIDRGNQIF